MLQPSEIYLTPSLASCARPNQLGSFVSNFFIPYSLEGIGSMTGFIFGATSILACLFVFFCIPECKGKSLEQIDRMFQEGVPIGKFASYAVDTLESYEAKQGGIESGRPTVERLQETPKQDV